MAAACLLAKHARATAAAVCGSSSTGRPAEVAKTYNKKSGNESTPVGAGNATRLSKWTLLQLNMLRLRHHCRRRGRRRMLPVSTASRLSAGGAACRRSRILWQGSELFLSRPELRNLIKRLIIPTFAHVLSAVPLPPLLTESAGDLFLTLYFGYRSVVKREIACFLDLGVLPASKTHVSLRL